MVMVPNPPPAQSTMLGDSANGLALAGAVTSAIGAYYSVKAAQYQAKAQASALQHQQDLSYINARQAERAAQGSILAGQRNAAMAGQRFAQFKAATAARQSGRGVVQGVGSAGEVTASIELSKQTDQLAITRASVREANAQRMGRVNEQNRGRAAGVGAGNLLRSAGTMNPYVAGGTTLIGGAGRVASNWYAVKGSR